MEGEMFWRDRNCVLGRTILMVSLPLHRYQAGVRKQFLECNNMKQRQKKLSHIFSCVHVTLQPTLSVGWLVGWLVGWSVGHILLSLILFF